MLCRRCLFDFTGKMINDRKRRKRGYGNMKIILIHGQNHKGSTYLIARELAEKIGGATKEEMEAAEQAGNLVIFECFDPEV